MVRHCIVSVYQVNIRWLAMILIRVQVANIGGSLEQKHLWLQTCFFFLFCQLCMVDSGSFLWKPWWQAIYPEGIKHDLLENIQFLDDFPIESFISSGFTVATFDDFVEYFAWPVSSSRIVIVITRGYIMFYSSINYRLVDLSPIQHSANMIYSYSNLILGWYIPMK